MTSLISICNGKSKNIIGQVILSKLFINHQEQNKQHWKIYMLSIGLEIQQLINDQLQIIIIPKNFIQQFSRTIIFQSQDWIQLYNNYQIKSQQLKPIQMTDQIKYEAFTPDSNYEVESEEESKQYFRKGLGSSTQGKWTEEQNLNYIMFMELNSAIFHSKQKRRLTKIFKLMSKCIKTRTAIQCRSHHQKLIIKYGNFKKIISLFKKEYDSQYSKQYQQFTQKWKPVYDLPIIKQETEETQCKSIEIQTDAVTIIQSSNQSPLSDMNCMYPSMFSAFMMAPQWFFNN